MMKLLSLTVLLLALQGCVYIQGGVSPFGGPYVRLGVDYGEVKEWAEDSGTKLPEFPKFEHFKKDRRGIGKPDER